MIHHSFLNPGRIIRSETYAHKIEEMQWKLQCLQLALVNRIGTFLHDNDTAPSVIRKLNELGYEVLSPPLSSPDLSPTNYHFLSISTNFCQENASTTSKMQKNAFKSLSNPTQGMDIYATGINRLSGEGSGYPLQYSCLENPMNRGAWQATVHRVA